MYNSRTIVSDDGEVYVLCSSTTNNEEIIIFKCFEAKVQWSGALGHWGSGCASSKAIAPRQAPPDHGEPRI